MQKLMIWRDSLVQQSQITMHMNVLFHQRPMMCKKENVSGVGSNERVVVVRNQHFQFYNVPKNYRQGHQKSIDQLIEPECKGRVNLKYIYEINYFPSDNQKKKIIEMLIPFEKVQLKNQNIYRSAIKPPQYKNSEKTSHLVRWVFQFSVDLKKMFRDHLEDQVRRQKQKQQRKVDMDIDKSLQDGILNISNISEVKKKSNVSFQSQDLQYDPELELDENIEKIQKIKDKYEITERLRKQELIRLQFMQKHGQKKKKDEEEELEVFPIRQYWRDYSLAYENLIRDNSTSLNQKRMELEIVFLQKIRHFQQEAKEIVKNYINEKLIGWKPHRTKFLDFQFYQGVWLKIGHKELNQEFLAYNILADIFLALKTIKGIKIRAPQVVFIKYKTFKVLCLSDMPFSLNKRQQEIYNATRPIYTLDIELVEKIKNALFYLQNILGIKNEMYFHSDNVSVTAPISHNLSVYQYKNSQDPGLINFLENFMYIINPKQVFPLDYNYQRYSFNPEFRVRPELIADWRDGREKIFLEDNQLLSQAFKASNTGIEEQEEEDRKIVDICDRFLTKMAVQLIEKLEQTQLIVVDSYSIKQYMSQMGINSRYLGLLYRMSGISYLKETFLIEMISRCIKGIYKETIHDMIRQNKLFKRKMIAKQPPNQYKKEMEQHKQIMRVSTIDFLNLVFGKGYESTEFWKIVCQKCIEKYDVKFDGPDDLKPGCLLFAVLWHCQIELKFDTDIPIFKVENPFTVEDNWKRFQMRSFGYQFPSLMIHKLTASMNKLNIEFDRQQEFQQALKSLTKFNYHNQISRYSQFSFQAQVELSRLNLFNKEYQKPENINPNHPIMLPYYFSNKSPQNFEKALEIMKFSLVDNHPLFISLYNEYSHSMEKSLLKKSALLVSIKGLGEYHPKTIELYSNYYKQGYKQFEKKAIKSPTVEGAFILCQNLKKNDRYEALIEVAESWMIKQKTEPILAENEIRMYLQILKNAIDCADQIRKYQTLGKFIDRYSEILTSFKLKDEAYHHFILDKAVRLQLTKTDKKYFLYKIVLLVLQIQEVYEPDASKYKDKNGFYRPRNQKERAQILEQISNQYFIQDTYSKWVANILCHLKRGYIYFNFLSDLFNNFEYHIKAYNIRQFKDSLGRLDTLVRYFGQQLFYDYLYEINVQEVK